MHVESREDIVEQDSCSPGVDRPCECHTCLFNRLGIARSVRKRRKNKPFGRH